MSPPPRVVPTKIPVCVTPVGKVQVKVCVVPGNVVPGLGLLIVAGTDCATDVPLSSNNAMPFRATVSSSVLAWNKRL